MATAAVDAGRARRRWRRRARAPALLVVGLGLAGWWTVARQEPLNDHVQFPRCTATSYPTQVQDCWRDAARSVYRVRRAHGAHRAIVAEVEITDLTDAALVARDMIPAITTPVDEVILYFRQPAAGEQRLRIRWTRTGGYEHLAF